MWKLLLPRTWQKKYPAPVKEHGLHLNVAGTATATATKNDAQVNAIKKPICTCNMRIRLLLAGWLMPPRLRQAKPEKSWNAQRNFRNPKNANWQPKKEQCCFFSHPVPRELTARGLILSSMRRFLWITNGRRQANIPNDRPGLKSAPALSKWPRAEMIGNF